MSISASAVFVRVVAKLFDLLLIRQILTLRLSVEGFSTGIANAFSCLLLSVLLISEELKRFMSTSVRHLLQINASDPDKYKFRRA